jgi:hypothetical protein
MPTDASAVFFQLGGVSFYCLTSMESIQGHRPTTPEEMAINYVLNLKEADQTRLGTFDFLRTKPNLKT